MMYVRMMSQEGKKQKIGVMRKEEKTEIGVMRREDRNRGIMGKEEVIGKL